MTQPDHLPVRRFLQNAALLLGTARRDSEAVQRHLSECLGLSHLTRTGSLNPQLLQSLDRVTQLLTELETAMASSAEMVRDDAIEPWPVLASRLRLQQVRDALGQGETATGAAHGATAAQAEEIWLRDRADD
ncbi:hypothetical protein SAMN05421538_10293 [Paracoccus isoporae]|uniref:Uncharacterized protein n=1 Tax=Paracoccus isoporae TaxID=591205 RepID=A0A1G6WDN3_9RHOB|nr:hypothetical protein [Paracoccus isoporae]SDD63367.1 hypothetical protein SAMN05421538_10293 [Paracoccus isoporae]